MTNLIFENHTLKTIILDGRKWMLPHQIGVAAGLSEPSKAIQKIYSRNKDEFDETMTRLVKIPGPSGAKETRVYSLRGAYLIGMKAQTEPAKRFRSWVLDILEDRNAMRIAQQIMINKMPRWSMIKLYHDMGRTSEQIAMQIGKPLGMVELHMRDMALVGLIEWDGPLDGDGLAGRHSNPSSSGPLFDAIHG